MRSSRKIREADLAEPRTSTKRCAQGGNKRKKRAPEAVRQNRSCEKQPSREKNSCCHHVDLRGRVRVEAILKRLDDGFGGGFHKQRLLVVVLATHLGKERVVLELRHAERREPCARDSPD